MTSKRSTWLAVSILPLVAPLAAAQTQDDLFNDAIVQELRFDIKPSDWDTLRARFLENTYYPITFHYVFQGKDTVVKDVEIRSRGHGSRSPVKPNLRIDFNRDVPGQKFLGLSSLVLKANNQDASMLRERAVFKLWDRTGLPVSREAHTRLYVNGVYYGVFLLTEEIRTEYLNRYLGEGDSDLYEWKPITAPQSGPIDQYHFEWYPTCKTDQLACSTDPNKWQPVPWNPEENKATFELASTIEMMHQINTVADADFERVVSGYTNLFLFLFHNAIENFVADFDAILGDVFGVNNIWIYRYDKSTYHQFLVWDKDGSYDYAFRPLFQNADQNVLFRRTAALPGRKNQYLESLYKTAVLAGGPGGWLEGENTREYNLIKQSVYADVFKQHNNENYTNDFWESEVQKNVQFIEQRAPWVISQAFAAGLQLPTTVSLSQGGVVNAANGTGPITPGSWISLYGAGFTGSPVVATNGFPTKLGGVTVIINGFPAPVWIAYPNQINVQVPWELGMGDGTAPVTVIVDGPTTKGTRAGSPVNGTFSNTITVPVGLYAPGIYAVTQQADGKTLDLEPAGAGDILTIYASGLGPVTVSVPTGGAAPSSPLSYTQQTPSVSIGGVNVTDILFSGLTPGTTGLYQINLRVPPGIKAGGAPLVIGVGGVSSPPLTIATR